MMKMMIRDIKKSNKGQSFVELALVISFILLLLAGVVEFGNLLNQYINIIDGAREGARFGSNNDPFIRVNDSNCSSAPTTFCDNLTFYQSIDTIVEGDPTATPPTKGAIAPIVLDPTRDDVVVSVFSVTTNPTNIKRFPNNGKGYWSAYGNHASEVTASDISSQLNSNISSSGIVVVEVFYDYWQILDLPFFTAVVPNPVTLHATVMMPLTAAEATPTPGP